MTKVLIIDDEKPTLNMFRLFLQSYGYEVFVAENGMIGLECVRREKPQIVFTDIKMPGIDGFQVLAEIKKIDSAIEVIVITGHGDMDLAVQALNLDATDFINKPIHRTALESALGRAEERLKRPRRESRVSLREAGAVSVIDIRGDLTTASENPLLQTYQSACERDDAGIVMHFDETASINGGGLSVLIRLLTESRRGDKAVAISGVSENFREIFTMVGITRFAPVFATEAEAVAALTQT